MTLQKRASIQSLNPIDNEPKLNQSNFRSTSVNLSPVKRASPERSRNTSFSSRNNSYGEAADGGQKIINSGLTHFISRRKMLAIKQKTTYDGGFVDYPMSKNSSVKSVNKSPIKKTKNKIWEDQKSEELNSSLPKI